MANRVFQRPTLTLTSNRSYSDRAFQVDMERFFEFSFDLAEDLLDLELKYATEPSISRLPSTAVRPNITSSEPAEYLGSEFNFDIDANWM